MNYKRVLSNFVLLLVFSFSIRAQLHNTNLISEEYGVSVDASSTFLIPPWMAPPSNIAHEKLQLRWEADNEIEGAWINVKWNEPQKIKELWIINKAVPFDFFLDPYMRTSNYLVPKNVKIIFSPEFIISILAD